MNPHETESARVQALERENRRLRRSVEELSLLNELSREIGASHDAEKITQTIIRRALKSVHAEQGTITLVEDGDEEMMKTLVRAAGSSIREDPYHLDDSLLGWMQHHKKPLVLDDPNHDARFQGTRWDASIRSILCVPLLARSRLIGVLTVYNKKAPDGFTEEDERLLVIMAAQSAQVVENARLYQEEQALLSVREEVRLAREIQTALLPEAPPEVPGYRIAGASRPAQSVGGDYFDHFPLDDERLALCVADVSGKGLPASLLMANVQATLHGQAPRSETVAACLERTNRLLCRRLRRGTFVTLFYGILDTRRHRFRYANAGHNRPLLRRADGAVARLDLGGLVLGFRPEQRYEEAVLSLAAGDVLLIYSDGLIEAMNERREQFGEDRLAALLQAHGHEPAGVLRDRLLRAVEQHAGDAPPTDDVTILVAQRTN